MMKVEFSNATGEMLSGRLELPKRTPRAFALFVHCFTCSKETIAATIISKTLTQAGIGVLRFDFTGLGNSQGDFSNTNFSSNVDDLLHAYSYIADKYTAPQLLIGHSLGGSAVLKAATRLSEVKAVVTIGAPSSVNHVTELFKKDLNTIEEHGLAEVNLAGRSFTIKKQFLEDLEETEFLSGINSFRKSLLVMHAPFDNIVSIDHATKIFTAAKHPKSFISLDNGDHLLAKRRDAEYAAGVIGAWVDRYLGKIDVESKQDSHVVGEGVVVVQSREGTKFTQDITTQDHHTLADEPLKVKGDNLGMSPYEYLLAGLGACTSMTMRMYADLKKIPLEGARVELRHEKIHAEDCLNCETVIGKIDTIEKEIQLFGPLSPAQKDRLYKIAEKCPVNRTLKSEIIIDSKHD
jgi:uncharacterized OsmC-like protein/esterase/lipase